MNPTALLCEDVMRDRMSMMSRREKRAILMAMDVALVVPSLTIALALRYGMTDPRAILMDYVGLFVLLVLAAPAAILAVGVNRIKLQAMDPRAGLGLALTAGVLTVVAMAASYMTNAGTPRSVPLLFGILYFVACHSARILALSLVETLSGRHEHRHRVLIYGAGSSGIHMASALRTSPGLRPVAFVDDNANLVGLQIAGLRVCQTKQLESVLARYKIDLVVLAIPGLSIDRRDEIIRGISRHGVDIKMMPSKADLFDRGVIDRKLRAIEPDELLGRDKVDLAVPAVAMTYAGRSVMVTGAGGSIGSELCRQLLDCSPSRIVLYDHSEFLLYNIDRELRALSPESKGITISTQLGSVTNRSRLNQVMRTEGVDLVLHAAAYKHVPLVEENELEGANNNVIGTRIVAEAAMAAGVERFVLVSTDKAVRPTNIMGATKRLAELVVQDLHSRSTTTKYSMVRFGNVLGSSGSVLPLFQRQIEQGGPVTVTHPDVTRFFMTIPEAARLVLLAGAFSTGGDVFVLDMGRPKKIVDIARQMIQLSGHHVQETPCGDGIEILFTGLRPGEKLYEELLIDDERLMETPHVKILRAEEESISEIETAAMLREVEKAISSGDAAWVRQVVQRYVRGYRLSVAADA